MENVIICDDSIGGCENTNRNKDKYTFFDTGMQSANMKCVKSYIK
jgi:hypothetical protein